MKFIGRGEELAKLQALWRKSTSSMVVVAGRRRIGKSTLVEEFARHSSCKFIEIVGLPPDEKMTNARQIENFCERLSHATGRVQAKADGWAQAFDALAEAISGREKTIVFLDEISWMGRYDSAFAGFLKTAWDTQLSKKSKLILVVAGSVSAWIQQNIKKSKAYVGRLSLDITLEELPIDDCLAFWGARLKRTALREILDALSVTGGVPKYLSELDPSLSADDNIRRLCFDANGYLFKDFNRIFDDVFDSTVASKKRIVTALSEGPASVSELAVKLGSDPNGHLSKDLAELVEAGFVAPGEGINPETGKRVREVRYRLKDNYTRFYLKYIEPKTAAIRAGVFKYTTLESLPGWDAIMGLQFENLVLNNFRAIAREIGLIGKNVESVAPYFRRGGKRGEGVQIDLLVQLPKCVYVIEVKRQKHLTQAIEEEVSRKIDRLTLPKGKSVKTVLIYEGDLNRSLEEDGFFDFVLPIDRLLSI